jgi:site-specific DNA-methyltransferase (adenine-specific)
MEPELKAPPSSLSLSCEDCMALMRRYPDKHFDLAIVDPPYGIGMDGGSRQYNAYEKKGWDKCIPSQEYFAELRRVSRNQIIWGGNYFAHLLPPSRCWIMWDKTIHGNSFADGELAWASFDKNVRIYPLNICHNQGQRFHPTQKPLKLYQWLLANYAKPGMKILDTHLGSGSHAIACHYAGMHLTACEIDPDYFAAAQERIKRETAQLSFL